MEKDSAIENLESISESLKMKMESAEKTVEEAREAVSKVSGDLTDQTKKLAETSVEIAKKYPLHTAVGAAALGFAVGLFLNRK